MAIYMYTQLKCLVVIILCGGLKSAACTSSCTIDNSVNLVLPHVLCRREGTVH